MLDLVVALARVLDIAAVQCSEARRHLAPESIDAAILRMLTDACTKTASDLTGAAVRASRLG